jgi:hypothetical protein
MRIAMVRAFATGAAESIGDAFNDLEAGMRRPVEILGLLQIATQVDAVNRARVLEQFDTVRPDGSRRSFAVPRIILDNDETAALSALTYGSNND